MKKRRQKQDDLPIGCNNLEYYGLHVGQKVAVKSAQFTGPALIKGTPPQGPGIYAVAIVNGKTLLLAGEDIAEATEPS